MSLEQQLREELSRSAEPIRSDPGGRRDEVVRTARHRRRVQRLVVASAVVAVVATGAVGLPHLDVANREVPPATSTWPPDPTGLATSVFDYHSTVRDRLTGDWATGPIPSRRVRVAIKAAGLTDADATDILKDARLWQTRMTFQITGGTTVQIRAWDASGGPVQQIPVEDNPYTLIGPNTLVLTRRASVTQLTFTYRVQGGRLFLHFEKAQPRPLSDAATAAMIAWTAAPLRRTGS